MINSSIKTKTIIAALTLSTILFSSCAAKQETYEPQPIPEKFNQETAICYEIFPISFADSNRDGKGDIKGITESLDYLKNDLNVDCIWLNPVHPSDTYHKYDVKDYYDIDPQLGSLGDYENLLAEAHKRGIRVVMDFVINHTSSKHPWFLDAISSPDSKYRDYYVWNDLSDKTQYPNSNGWYSVAGQDEKYYASFWSEMPELNYENPKVREEIKNIAKFWLDKGVDGFRIDAAKIVYNVGEYGKDMPVQKMNIDWFIEFNDYIKSVNKDSMLILENWDTYNSVSRYLVGTDSSFNFDLAKAITSAVQGESRNPIQGKVSSIYKAYDKVTDQYMDSVFLANHDQDRILSVLGDNPDKAKLAAAIEFTLPGKSWIYYGEEIGMTARKPDEAIREPFKWTQSQKDYPNAFWELWKYNADLDSLSIQKNDQNSIFAQYKILTKLKSENETLRNGSYIDNSIGKSFRIFSYYRQSEDQTLLVIHNLHKEPKKLRSESELGEIVYSSSGSVINGMDISLGAYGSLVIKVNSSDIGLEEVK